MTNGGALRSRASRKPLCDEFSSPIISETMRANSSRVCAASARAW